MPGVTNNPHNKHGNDTVVPPSSSIGHDLASIEKQQNNIFSINNEINQYGHSIDNKSVNVTSENIPLTDYMIKYSLNRNLLDMTTNAQKYKNKQINNAPSKKSNSDAVLYWQLGGITVGAVIGGAIGFIGGPVGAALGAAAGGWLGGLGGLIIGSYRDKKSGRNKKPGQSNNKINSSSDEPPLQATNGEKLERSHAAIIKKQPAKQSMLNDNKHPNNFQSNQNNQNNNCNYAKNKNNVHNNNAPSEPQLITQDNGDNIHNQIHNDYTDPHVLDH